VERLGRGVILSFKTAYYSQTPDKILAYATLEKSTGVV
jgi:hypothetical protein